LKIAIYARISTKEQSPDSQLFALRDYSKARKWDVFKEYVDIGISGAKQMRPALNQMMEDARKRRFDCVLVFKLDRLGRSLSHLVHSLEEFQNLGIHFISYQENIDLSQSTGKLMFHLLSAMAEFERDLIRERVNAGIKAARAKGKKFGRPRSINRAHVRALRQEGMSLRAIAKKMKISQAGVYKVVSQTTN